MIILLNCVATAQAYNLLFNDIPDSTGSFIEITGGQILVNTSVKDADGAAIAGLPINFANLNTNYGILSSNVVTSSSDGTAL